MAKIVENDHVGFRHQLAIAFSKVTARHRVERTAQQPAWHRGLDQRTHPARPVCASLFHVMDQACECLAPIVAHEQRPEVLQVLFGRRLAA